MAVVKISKENFTEKVLNNPQTVLLDFYADWCGPCQMVSPIVEEISNEYSEYTVGKINVDQEPELAQKFGITSIPALFAVKDAKIVNSIIGYRPKEDIVDLL